MIPPSALTLLDTSVLVHLIRWNTPGQWIDQEYNLTGRPNRPLVSVVTHGELLALGRRNNWGKAKMAQIPAWLSQLVEVDINSGPVLDNYAEIYEFAITNGLSIHKKQNDLWIAASSVAASAVLITTDGEFRDLDPRFLPVEWIDPAHLQSL